MEGMIVPMLSVSRRIPGEFPGRLHLPSTTFFCSRNNVSVKSGVSLPRCSRPIRQRHVATRSAMTVEGVRGGISGLNRKFGVVVALFNDVITKPLLAGALDTFDRHGVAEYDVKVVYVPGSFEIPVVAQRLANSRRYDAILCIGAVVRGSTTHYDAVANSAASGVLNAGLGSGVPCIFGVLTCETMEQAMDRAGGKLGNKGSEAALTAIEMANLFKLL